MAIFNSYVSLPEGTRNGAFSAGISHATCRRVWFSTTARASSDEPWRIKGSSGTNPWSTDIETDNG